jgi:hypothetical protein
VTETDKQALVYLKRIEARLDRMIEKLDRFLATEPAYRRNPGKPSD